MPKRLKISPQRRDTRKNFKELMAFETDEKEGAWYIQAKGWGWGFEE